MNLIQMPQDLLAAMELANVPLSIVFVNPWINSFGAPMLSFNLRVADISNGHGVRISTANSYPSCCVVVCCAPLPNCLWIVPKCMDLVCVHVECLGLGPSCC